MANKNKIEVVIQPISEPAIRRRARALLAMKDTERLGDVRRLFVELNFGRPEEFDAWVKNEKRRPHAETTSPEAS